MTRATRLRHKIMGTVNNVFLAALHDPFDLGKFINLYSSVRIDLYKYFSCITRVRAFQKYNFIQK